MAFEVPYDQIKELQISLRKEAGLETYDPENPEFPDLPLFEDAISELDPSHACLRCKHCKGGLLRGINSLICVFCGIQQNKDVPPDPIKFTSTSGCSWFLHSLDLDGSELVAPSVESSESMKGHNTQEIEFPLSDLLDLEIKWLSQPEKIEINVSESATAQKLSNVNVAGVDTDNFFTEARVDSASGLTEEQSAMSRHEDASGNNAFQVHGNLSLFENVKPPELSGDEFSSWEASFQSAGSGTQHQESKLSDPFIGSPSGDISSHIDSVSGSGKVLFDEKRKENSSSSDMNDWFEGGIWSSSNAVAAAQEDYLQVPNNNNNQKTIEKTNDSFSMDADWFQGNQWETATSSTRATENRSIVEDDDSFDDWNDFTSSSNAQVSSSNPMVPSVEGASEIDFFGGTNNSKDVDFGSFSQPDFFLSTFNKQNNSKEMNITVPESHVSDKMVSMNGTGESGLFLNGSTESKAADVEKLMSQMHDLSFMLHCDISVGQKSDSSKD